MKKSAVISVHVLYWIIYMFFTYSSVIIHEIFKEGAGNYSQGYVSLFLFNAVSCFYISYFWLVPQFLAKRKITLFILSNLILSLVTSLIVTAIIIAIASMRADEIIQREQIPAFGIALTWLFFTILIMIMGLVNSFLATLVWGFITWHDEIRLKEIMTRKQIETELALLKAQLNPHFLFNTLNNIDILIVHDQSAASTYLNKLSDIMRFVLYETKSERIDFEKELEYIRKYVDLQKIRTTNEDYVKLNVKMNHEGVELVIAPMLFIPFIENAFKYSNNKKTKDAVVIRIETTPHDINFYCRNAVSQKPERGSNDGGLGLDLIKQRLNLSYKDNHVLTINQTDTFFEVNLIVNINDH